MPAELQSPTEDEPRRDPARSLRDTELAGDDPPGRRALSLQATQPVDAGDLSLQKTRPALASDTLAADGPTRRERSLPAPDLDGIESDRLKGAIMSELFGAPAEAVKIGRFTVLDRLGEGGMGVVYAAYDAQLDRKIAVKLLRPDTVGDDASARTRLLREAQAMARVSHPNLITVHEVGSHHGAVYVAMEFIKGKSLDRWLAARPGWRDVVDAFLAAGRGLAAAHAAGLVHRDFKPHNVMRGDDGSVKVLDFGLARAVGALPPGEDEGAAPTALLDARMTRTGAVMGTPAYMSPEQHEGKLADARSDQFSFCVALYEGLYGRLPFAGDTLPELIGNVIEARVLPPPDDAAPRWLARVVLRGLSLAPGDRWPTMEALLDALARDPTRRRRLVVLGAGLSTALIGSGFALASMSEQTGPPPCAGAGDELAAVWGEPRREAARAGLLAAAPGLAATTWQTVAPRLDDYARDWAAMRTEACQAHQAGRQSAALLDLRMTCLDRRLAGLDALAGVFASADGDTVVNAVAAVDGLAPLAGCADVERLTAAVPLPDDPARARAVRAQQLALEKIAADQLTGRYAAAKAAAEAVTAAAAGLEHAPLTAEAALARARAHQELKEGEPADRALTEALAAAIRGRADAIAAEAAARQIFVRGSLLSSPRLGLAAVELADALIDRAGDPPYTRWLWALNTAIASVFVGELEPARALFKRAGEVAAAAGLDQAVALTVFDEGFLAAEAGDHETAAARFGSGLARIEAKLGVDHPLASQMRTMLAQARWELGQTALVRELLDREVPRLRATFGPASVDVQQLQLLLAEIDLKYRRFEAARARAAEVAEHPAHAGQAADAERLLGAALVGLGRADEGFSRMRAAIDRAGDLPMLRLVQQSYLGDALRDAGRLDDALAAHREALAGFVAGAGEDAAFTAIVRAHLARTLLARGALDEAHRELVAARDVFLARQPRSPYLGEIVVTLGEVERARGRHDVALAAFQEADDRRAASFDRDHPDRNATRFLLAQELAARDPSAAVALAHEAAEVYATLGEPFAPERAAIETWLARQTK